MDSIGALTFAIKQVLARSKKIIAASLALTLCALWPGATLSVQEDSGKFAPRQAIVFDGSLNSDSTFGVAFTAEGILGQVSSPRVTCSGESSPPDNSTTHLSPERVGVFTPISEPVIDAALDPSVSWPNVSAPPRFLDDCDAAGQFSVLTAYLDASVAQAEQLGAEVEQCAAETQEEACILSDLISQILTRDDGNMPGDLCWPNSLSPSLTLILGFGCQRCSDGVLSMPFLLNDLQRARASCGRNSRQLKDLIAHYTLVRERGERIPSAEKTCVLRTANELRATAQDDLTYLDRIRESIYSITASCEYQEVNANCEACAPLETLSIQPRRAVIIERGFPHMGRLVGAFQSAAGQSLNQPDRERFRNLAQRLAQTPQDRVLHITAPADSSVSQLYVAVRPFTDMDDGESPLLVVLTLMSRDAQLPEMTLSDRQAFSDALRVFASTLKPVCAPDAACK